MAKKKQGKNKKKKDDASDGQKSAATPTVILDLDRAYKSGDYAAVRRLADQAEADDTLSGEHKEHVSDVVEMVRTDPQVWMVGAAATTIAIIVGIITLGG